jgi:YnbE-like lipoprotein
MQTHEEGNQVTTVQTATRAWALTLLIASGVWAMGGCTPRVEVVPSDKPITINLNVKIDHEIRIKIEKELQEALSEKNGLF